MISQISNQTATAVNRVQQATSERSRPQLTQVPTEQEVAETTEPVEAPVATEAESKVALLPDSVELSAHFSEITQPTFLPEVDSGDASDNTSVDVLA